MLASFANIRDLLAKRGPVLLLVTLAKRNRTLLDKKKKGYFLLFPNVASLVFGLMAEVASQRSTSVQESDPSTSCKSRALFYGSDGHLKSLLCAFTRHPHE